MNLWKYENTYCMNQKTYLLFIEPFTKELIPKWGDYLKYFDFNLLKPNKYSLFYLALIGIT